MIQKIFYGETNPLTEQAGEANTSLFKSIAPTRPRHIDVIIEIHLDHPLGREAAKLLVYNQVAALQGEDPEVRVSPADSSRHYVFATLTMDQLSLIVAQDLDPSTGARAIYKVWPDHNLEPFIDRSVRMIKADACYRTFDATGENILWAVIDSGIDGDHPHFARYGNLLRDPGTAETDGEAPLLRPRDFTGGKSESPLTDGYGHGTHVAGIIAGASPPAPAAKASTKGEAAQPLLPAFRIRQSRNELGQVRTEMTRLPKSIQGVAPQCQLLSLKVLDDKGAGKESSLLAALDYVARVNEHGDRMRIHGVNISLGYPFLSPEWYAAGHSPPCAAVNRLAAQGVIVVVAAGNDGSAVLQTEANKRRVGLSQSIADPGNAEDAITVGSTHPNEPLKYGVSYFSGKGPTADGRMKPDLLAPGERILSCASTAAVAKLAEDIDLEGQLDPKPGEAYYREQSGTSMAAPHVSGAIAAFLSVRGELIGQPRRIKELLMDGATDLKRAREFQGALQVGGAVHQQFLDAAWLADQLAAHRQ
ncbi:MAG: hypothetical protein EON88_22080, partial [Brevundimonas sp.]